MPMNRGPSFHKFKKQTGKNLRRIRKEKGMSAYVLGIAIGSDASNIIRIEDGKVSPSSWTICKIARFLDVKVEDICPVPKLPPPRKPRVY